MQPKLFRTQDNLSTKQQEEGHKKVYKRHHRPESAFAGKTIIKEAKIPSSHIPVTNPKCKCKEEDGGCFNKLDWYIKISISVDGDIWHELKPKTEPTRGTEILTGIIDIPKYLMEQSTDGNVQFKFTQNIKQCICCDDLFIRLVKPLREESSYKNNDDEDSQFIGYDGFY